METDKVLELAREAGGVKLSLEFQTWKITEPGLLRFAALIQQQMELIGEVKESGVVWANQNPHAYPIGTKFYTAPQSGVREVNTDTVSVPREFHGAVKRLVIAARTSGGTAGRDVGLCEALDAVEAMLRAAQEAK